MALAIANRRWSDGVCSSSSIDMSALVSPKPRLWKSMARMAFCMASSNDLPMLMTSPMLFIEDPSWVETRVNFFRSQRGILTTT